MEVLSKNKTRYLRKFLQKKIRREQRKCLIEGEKLCLEALNNGFEIEILVYCRGKGKDLQKIVNHPRVLSVFTTTGSILESISDVETPQDIIALVSLPEPPGLSVETGSKKSFLILDNISDPGNTGTIIRTASWFGWDGVICSSGCVEITNGKVIRSSMGAVFHLPVWENVDLLKQIDLLRSKGFMVLGSVLENGSEIPKNSNKTALVIGNEATGISKKIIEKCDRLVSIHGKGKAESLNAAVSTGILLDRLGIIRHKLIKH